MNHSIIIRSKEQDPGSPMFSQRPGFEVLLNCTFSVEMIQDINAAQAGFATERYIELIGEDIKRKIVEAMTGGLKIQGNQVKIGNEIPK